MYLKHQPSGDLVEVTDLTSLVDPLRDKIQARFHHGEELQEPEDFDKGALMFPSGEALPKCWVDPHYRDAEVA